MKYHDVSDQIEYREVTFEKVSYGVKRFIIGLSKKMLIANTLGSVADKIFSQPVEQFDALTAWTGAFAYSLQLFYDFSGYSDMAIGLGMIFGFRFWRTSIIRTYRVRLRSSGVGGIYRCRRGLGSICIYRSEGTGLKNGVCM